MLGTYLTAFTRSTGARFSALAKEYFDILDQAASARKDEDYPSSSQLQAQVEAATILQYSRKIVRIFTTRPERIFGDLVAHSLLQFLKSSTEARLDVLAIEAVREQVDGYFSQLDFPHNKLSVFYLERVAHPDTCANLMYGDDSASRYEEFDLDGSGTLASLTNFGNRKRVGNFERIILKLCPSFNRNECPRIAEAPAFTPVSPQVHPLGLVHPLGIVHSAAVISPPDMYSSPGTIYPSDLIQPLEANYPSKVIHLSSVGSAEIGAPKKRSQESRNKKRKTQKRSHRH